MEEDIIVKISKLLDLDEKSVLKSLRLNNLFSYYSQTWVYVLKKKEDQFYSLKFYTPSGALEV